MPRGIRGRLMPVPVMPSVPNRGFTRHGVLSAPVGLYTKKVTVPLSGAQGFATMDANGAATISIGPTGLGTTWYPASAVISTTLGVADTSSVNIYVGPPSAPLPNTLQGTINFQAGQGVISLAIPALSPGLAIIAVWSGGIAGTVCSMNVTGTAEILTRE